jgi:hypothetical protein
MRFGESGDSLFPACRTGKVNGQAKTSGVLLDAFSCLSSTRRHRPERQRPRGGREPRILIRQASRRGLPIQPGSSSSSCCRAVGHGLSRWSTHQCAPRLAAPRRSCGGSSVDSTDHNALLPPVLSRFRPSGDGPLGFAPPGNPVIGEGEQL